MSKRRTMGPNKSRLLSSFEALLYEAYIAGATEEQVRQEYREAGTAMVDGVSTRPEPTNATREHFHSSFMEWLGDAIQREAATYSTDATTP